MLKIRNDLIRRAASERLASTPPATCPNCGGCGFVDYVDANTGGIVYQLCRFTRACSLHADKCENWAAIALVDALVRREILG